MSAKRLQARILSNEPTTVVDEPTEARRRRLRFKPTPPASMQHAVASLGVSTVAGATFLWLASQVMTSERIVALDAAAFEIALSLHASWLTTFMTWITRIGNSSVLAVLTILVGVWLARIGSRRRLIAFAATMVLGGLLNVLLKSSAQRPRPGVFEHLVRASGYSFPSGHSMGSMLFFGSLAYVLAVTLEAHHIWRAAAVVACLLCAVAIGFSRVYLGVHYFSDVVGGFAAGICWIGICIAATEAWTARRNARAV